MSRNSGITSLKSECSNAMPQFSIHLMSVERSLVGRLMALTAAGGRACGRVGRRQPVPAFRNLPRPPRARFARCLVPSAPRRGLLPCTGPVAASSPSPPALRAPMPCAGNLLLCSRRALLRFALLHARLPPLVAVPAALLHRRHRAAGFVFFLFVPALPSR